MMAGIHDTDSSNWITLAAPADLSKTAKTYREIINGITVKTTDRRLIDLAERLVPSATTNAPIAGRNTMADK